MIEYEDCLKHLKYIIFFTLMTHSLSVAADDFQYKVSYHNIQYTLSYGNKSLAYSDSGFSRTFKRRKCNEVMVDTYLSNLKKAQKNLFPPATQTKQAIVVQDSNNKTQSYSPSSGFGKFLQETPKKILNMAIREKHRCKD